MQSVDLTPCTMVGSTSPRRVYLQDSSQIDHHRRVRALGADLGGRVGEVPIETLIARPGNSALGAVGVGEGVQ